MRSVSLIMFKAESAQLFEPSHSARNGALSYLPKLRSPMFDLFDSIPQTKPGLWPTAPLYTPAMAKNIAGMRKTRFVCISDTHNATPNGSFKLPKGDVLIHAGDLTNQGTFSELQKTVKWIEEANFESKIVIAGNHDITLDKPFYDQHGLYFHNQNPQDTERCLNLLEHSPSFLYLKHEAAVVSLSAPDGPQTRFKIFGSPYSPAMGMWAFGYSPGEAAQLWEKVPLDSDIVVTHTPPKFHCDERTDRRAVGCEALRSVLWRVRPRLAICGHIHESRGAEIIKWELATSNIKYKEASVERWEDPGKYNRRISLVDLTYKGRTPIANDGATGDLFGSPSAEIIGGGKTHFSSASFTGPSATAAPSLAATGGQPTTQNDLLHVAEGLFESATRGQGGMPPSLRCDLEAISGRLGRKETCIINAAIMASSWPHNGAGGKKFNKPIVVDIDLPIWPE